MTSISVEWFLDICLVKLVTFFSQYIQQSDLFQQRLLLICDFFKVSTVPEKLYPFFYSWMFEL